MKGSFNPFAYHPAQIAKALVAVPVSIIGLAGVIASVASTGDLSVIGHGATAVALFLAPIVVFLTKAERIADVLDPAVTADEH